MKLFLFHLPLIGMLLILGFFALLEAGKIDLFRSGNTYAWMMVVWYPLIGLLGLAQVALWGGWIVKRVTRSSGYSKVLGLVVAAAIFVVTLLIVILRRSGLLE